MWTAGATTGPERTRTIANPSITELQQAAQMAKLGLIGLGNLGRALGEQLSKASLVVFDRHAAKTLENAVTVASVADVVARSTTVVSCVPDDAAATAVADELLSAAKPGLLHVSVSTLSPVCATDLERKHQEAGVGFVAAPVFARPENMRAGQASFALSGGDAALRRRAVDEALSHAAPAERCFDFGDSAGAAAAAKLTGNFMIAGAIEALAEGLDLAEGQVRRGNQPVSAICADGVEEAP